MRNGYRDELLLDAEEESESVERRTTGVEADEISEIIEETKKEIRAIFAADGPLSGKKVTKNA